MKKGRVKKLRRESRADRTLTRIMARVIQEEIDKNIIKKLRKIDELEKLLNKDNTGVPGDF